MIALVTILFGFTWLPLHSFLFAMKVFKCFPFGNSSLYTIKTLTHTLPYLNSMLNPFFYTIMGNNFRKKISKKFSNQNNNKYDSKSFYSHNKLNGSVKNSRFTSARSDIISNSLKNRSSVIHSNLDSSDHEQIVLLKTAKNSKI
jgi:hypothetical protein